jgi:hypothetical protein
MKEPDQDEFAILPQETEPDPEEVRRALVEEDKYQAYASDAGRTLGAAARAWLRLREQPPPPERPLTIEQVIAVCGESGVHIRKRYNVNGYEDGYEAVGFTIPYTPGRDLWVCGDTAEAALRALLDQSIAKLKAERDECTEKLRKLGVEP